MSSFRLNLNYTMLGEKRIFPFEVHDENISGTDVVKHIAAELVEPVRPAELSPRLLKEPIPFEQSGSNPWLFDTSIDLNDYATYVIGPQNLLSVWTTREPKCLHATVSRSHTSLKRKLSNMEYPAQKRSDFERAHHPAISVGLKAAAPSSASKVNTISNQQDKYPLYNGRPPDNCAFDIRLFHPVFENFSRQYHGSEKLANEEKAVAHNFLVGSAGYYETESARRDTAKPSLEVLLGRSFMDGTIPCWDTQNGLLVPLLLFDVKNEIGTGGADITTQVGLSYREHWSQNEDMSRASCCPAFLLAFTGSWLCVLGAVFTDKPIVQPLTPLLWLGRLHARKQQYKEVTRLFAALSTGISELDEFYSRLNFTLVSEARFSPYITTFTDSGTGREVQFGYERYADPIPGGTRAVSIANTHDDRKIVIKFKQEYNDAAHSLLAAKGLAPPLLSCDRSVFGDFTIVIMGYVDGKQLLHKYRQATPAEVLEKISEALKILHANDLVFGDLRPPNILITDQSHVQLVDFDWCGKVGEMEYPPGINLVDIRWPKGVVPGGLLQFKHDEEMFQRLNWRD